jgi:hypothetical protein
MSAAIVKYWFMKQNEFWNISNLNSKDQFITETNRGIVGSINETLDMFGYNYGQPIPDLSEYDKVIMCDVSFKTDIMKQLHRTLTAQKGYIGNGKEKTPNNFIWCDHHISAIKDMEKEYSNNSVPISLPFGLRDIKFAACELTWKYFFSNETMPEIVRLLGRYDCFGHKGTPEEQKVLEFQYGARQLISNITDAHTVLIACMYYSDGINNNNPCDDILNAGKSIYKYLCTEAKQIYNRVFPVNIDGCVFACVNQERFNPINFGIDYHKDGYDGFLCYHYQNNQYNYSLYNDNGMVDCSVIARSMGGWWT